MFASTDKMFSCPPRSLIMEPKWKSSVELAPNCPRCASSNTKFCYYNNYSLSQPRYFCKGCRRYWTKGGSLRNVPVGGGYRKTRRGKPVRMSPAERVSMAYSHLQPSSDSFNPPLEISGSSIGNSVNGASEIDLAVVFAKYLNQNPCESTISAPELPNAIEETSFDASNSSNPSADSPSSLQILQETNMFEFQNQFESTVPDTQLINGGSAGQVFPGENQLQETIINPQLMICHEQNANYGLDSLLMSNELVSSSDVLWPVTPAASNLFTWHLPELQEFEPVLIPEDHLMIYPNLVTETWGSFE